MYVVHRDNFWVIWGDTPPASLGRSVAGVTSVGGRVGLVRSHDTWEWCGKCWREGGAS